MKNKNINEMIDQEFDEFEQDRNKRKNIREFISFNNSGLEYSQQKFEVYDIRFKKKLTASVYVKNNGKNQLF